MAIVRSMWTTDNNHGAQLEFLSGHHLLDGCFPTVGAWIHYGLGSLNDNLPQFVVLGDFKDTRIRQNFQSEPKIKRSGYFSINAAQGSNSR